MPFKQDLDHQPILSPNGSATKEVHDFKYLGSLIANSKKDFNSPKFKHEPLAIN